MTANTPEAMDERAAFEDWFRATYDREPDRLRFADVGKWIAWEARAKLPPPQGNATWIRNAALKEAYAAMFDIKGDKATRFDAQTAIRNLMSNADGQTPGGQDVPDGR